MPWWYRTTHSLLNAPGIRQLGTVLCDHWPNGGDVGPVITQRCATTTSAILVIWHGLGCAYTLMCAHHCGFPGGDARSQNANKIGRSVSPRQLREPPMFNYAGSAPGFKVAELVESRSPTVFWRHYNGSRREQCRVRFSEWDNPPPPVVGLKTFITALLCKVKRQYLLTCKVARYFLLAERGSAVTDHLSVVVNSQRQGIKWIIDIYLKCHYVRHSVFCRLLKEHMSDAIQYVIYI